MVEIQNGSPTSGFFATFAADKPQRIETMNILICNDDGISAPGIHYLIERAKKFGHLTVVAPDAPRSGQSGALTVNSPLTITPHKDLDGAEVFSVSGTPVDCVKLALHAIVREKPDLMLCGINHGTNAGNCVLYSGTMGAVLEACSNGIPAIGYSLTHHSWDADFSECGPIVDRLTEAVIRDGLPGGVCLNVNIPARCKPLGIKAVRAANGYWTEEYEEYTSPHGKPFYWLTGHFENQEPDNPATDEYWLARQWATAVPVEVNPSALAAIPTIENLLR